VFTCLLSVCDFVYVSHPEKRSINGSPQQFNKIVCKIVNPRIYYKKREDLADEYRYLGYWSSALDLDMKPALRKFLQNKRLKYSTN
jgi:hypothetical protein